MTDKQIIIDGVDVSGCKLYRDEVSFVGGETITDVCSIWIWQRDYSGLEPSCVMKCHCSDNSNCYYKQLKRKEQACKVLALDARVADNHLQHRIEMCDLLREKLKAKEQECNKLYIQLKADEEYHKEEENTLRKNIKNKEERSKKFREKYR